ncbi:MAG: hypothetical protein ACLUP5_01820 [Streptococcus sp.]
MLTVISMNQEVFFYLQNTVLTIMAPAVSTRPREFYKQIHKNVANERYKNLLPMGISVFVMGVAAFVLHEDQDFQNRVYA